PTGRQGSWRRAPRRTDPVSSRGARSDLCGYILRERTLFRVRSRRMDDHRTGRRFRRRLLAVMLAAGLLPLAGGSLVVGFGLSRMLSLSLGRLDPLLERAQAAARDPTLSRELSQARVDLLQAELARRSLARLAPWALLAAVV